MCVHTFKRQEGGIEGEEGAKIGTVVVTDAVCDAVELDETSELAVTRCYVYIGVCLLPSQRIRGRIGGVTHGDAHCFVADTHSRSARCENKGGIRTRRCARSLAALISGDVAAQEGDAHTLPHKTNRLWAKGRLSGTDFIHSRE